MGGKGNLAAIWGPRGLLVECGNVGESHRIAAIGVHHVDLGIAISVGGKGNLAAIWGPRGILVDESGIIGEPGRRTATSVGIHHVDLGIIAISVRGEGNLAAIRGP